MSGRHWLRKPGRLGRLAAITTAVTAAASVGRLAPSPSPAAAVDVEPPNVVVMLVDDMGWGDSPVHNSQSRIPMPNLQRLAASGMTFTRAYATPKCAPTRYSLLTGNDVGRGRFDWGAWNYRGGGGSQILPGQQTIGTILDRHGYDTGFVGKLHLGGNFYVKGTNQLAKPSTPEEQIDFDRGLFQGPRSYGFDYSYTLLRGVQASPYAYFENDRLIGDDDEMVHWPAGTYGDSVVLDAGIGMPDWDSTQVGEHLTRAALDFIDRHHDRNLAQGTDDPFLLYFASPAPHDPVTPPASMLGVPIKGVTGLGNRADMVYQNDLSLGLILDALDDRGLMRDTLVVFLSDNGGVRPSPPELALGHDKHAGLRGHKGEIWEGGTRTPLVAMWGDGTPTGSVIPPGTTSDQLVVAHDLPATLAAVVGENLPIDQARESHDLLPVLTGEQPPDVPVREWWVSQARERAGQQVAPHFAIYDRRWKLVLDENDTVAGLYDLLADPGETTNRAGEPAQAARVRRMCDRLLALRTADRTAPVMALPAVLGPGDGTPPFTPAVDDGVFLWQDTAGGPLHLRASAVGPRTRFDVTVLADRAFSSVTPVGVESGDTIAVDANTLRFTAWGTNWWDGVDIELPAAADVVIQVAKDGTAAPHLLRLGPAAAPVSSNAWLVADDALPAPPAFTGGRDLGFFLGRVPTGPVSVRLNGDGAAHRLAADVIASRPISVTGVNVESQDTLTSLPRAARLEGDVGVWWDGLDVQAPAGTTFAVHVEDHGVEPVHLLNPLPGPGNLGLPNAHWISR